ncbi:hypothetical protein [Roseivirga sp.]|uniref:hypothetical protein n=1 Tax=Roseivirga sp. TaxID=1964215 RepID=UPI003B8D1F2A
MILISHPPKDANAERWKERLERMTVPHLLIASNKPMPILKENQHKVTGTAAIDSFLDEFEKDLRNWNQDRCDMWFFDED